LSGEYEVVSIDCWNAFSEGATVARFRIEHHQGGQVEVEHADRRYHELARAGVLSSVAADWLVQENRGMESPRRNAGPSKKEIEQRARSEAFLNLLIERGALELVTGSSIANLADRTRRILFVIARTRVDAVNAIRRMFEDTKHVVHSTGDNGARISAIHAALDSIHY
jgi:hypothetical protein